MLFKNSVLALTLVLAGCVSTNPATGGKYLRLMSQEQEAEIGQEVAVEAIKEYGGLYTEMPELTAYLDARVQEVVAASHQPNRTFLLRLLDDEILNAFAVPGYTMISRGLLPFLNSEAELVGVLGHEVSHVTAQHFARTHSTGTLLQGALIVGQIFLNNSANVNPQVADAASQVAGLAANIGFAGYSRSHELEADRLGLQYMAKLGYEPAEMADVFRTFDGYGNMMKKIMEAGGAKQDMGIYHQLLSSHPEDQKRIRQIAEQMQENGYNGTKRHVDRYLDMIDGIAFGPSPEQGFGGKEHYYNVKKGYTFKVPTGWFFPNQSRLPIAVNLREKAFVEVKSTGHPTGRDVRESILNEFPNISYLKEIEMPQGSNIQAITGLLTRTTAGALGTTKDSHKTRLAAFIENNSTRDMTIMLFSVDEGGFDMLDADFIRMAQSFRFLTPQQAADIQPLRVKIYTVQEGEKLPTVLDKLAFGAFTLEWFRLLNGLWKNPEVTPGQRVKLVINPNVGLIE